MKIALFLQNFSNYMSGGRYYAYLFAAALGKLGHEVKVITDNHAVYEENFVEVPGWDKVEIIESKHFQYCNRIENFKGVDLFVGFPVIGVDYAVTMATLHKKPSIAVCYEPQNWIQESGKTTPDKSPGYWEDYVKRAKQSTMFLLLTNIGAEYAKKWIPELKDRIHVLYAGINSVIAAKVEPKPIEARENAIAFVSRADKHKGYQKLWSLFGTHNNVRPHIYFVTGYLPDDIKNEITINCAAQQLPVSFHHNCSDLEKYQILGKVKALLYPTKFEGFGLPPAEAALMNTPVLASSLPVLKEVYGDNLHYLSDDSNSNREKIKGLFENQAELFSKTVACKEHVQKFALYENFVKGVELALQRLQSKEFGIPTASPKQVRREQGKAQPVQSKPQVVQDRIVKTQALIKPTPRFNVDKKMSIVVPVYNTKNEFLEKCLNSIKLQSHEKLEVIIVDDGTKQENLDLIKTFLEDKRFTLVSHEKNMGIPAAMTTGINAATGDYTCLVDSDDIIDLRAIENVLVAHQQTKADVIYTNETNIDASDRILSVTNKPDWSQEYLLLCQYLNHLTSYKTEFVKSLMPCRDKYSYGWDHDLVLRASSKTPKIAHLPVSTYYWRIHPEQTGSAKRVQYVAHGTTFKATNDFLKKQELKKKISIHELPAMGTRTCKHHIVGDEPSVLITVLTRNIRYLYYALMYIGLHTDYKNYDILVMEHDPKNDSGDTIETFVSQRKHLYMRMNQPFNFSKFYNEAFDKYGNEYDYTIVFNDDIFVGNRWLTELIAMFDYRFEKVGVVGAKLLYPPNDNIENLRFPMHWKENVAKIQHAGVKLLSDQHAKHMYHNRNSDLPVANIVRPFDTVTFALVAISKECYKQIRMNEELPVEYNDMDFCIRAKEEGWQTIYNPFAVAFHLSTVTRKIHGIAGVKEDMKKFLELHGDLLSQQINYQQMTDMENMGI